jgi:hypothetical protein
MTCMVLEHKITVGIDGLINSHIFCDNGHDICAHIALRHKHGWEDHSISIASSYVKRHGPYILHQKTMNTREQLESVI